MIVNRLLYGSSLILTSKILKQKNLNRMYINNHIIKPLMNVSIILPTLNEEDFVEKTLQSVHEQNIIQQYPEFFEIILVDSNSTDNTVNIAKPYVNKILLVDKGKLTARQIATKYTNGEIIVSIDADTYYPPNWLNNMLKYYNDKNVIAVSGNRYFIKSHNILYETIYDIYSSIFKPLHYKMSGGNSSYLKSAYYYVGEFNLNINQQNVKEMINEEEINFYRKLSKLGKIINTSLLPVLTSDRHLIRSTNQCVTEEKYCKDISFGERF